MSQVTGIVQEVNNRGIGKGSNILVNGTKYGCYDPVKAGIDMLVAGQEVTFDTAVKGQYVNINGRATPTGNSGAVTAPAPAAQPQMMGKAQGSDFVFPVPPLNYQRSVVRRDSIRDAVALVNEHTSGCENDMDIETRIAHTLAAAKAFEEYSCGDDIEKEAAAAVAQLGTSQPTQ